MAKRHLKRLAAPKSWGILRKEETFITRPNPGSHQIDQCLPMSLLLKRMGYANTSREAKRAMNINPVLIDGKRVKSPKAQAGLFDEASIGDKRYRVVIDHRGHLITLPIKEDNTGFKPCKIIGKTLVKGNRLQANTSDGRNLILEPGVECSVGDTLIITTPKQSVKEQFKFETGAFVYLIGGKHLGDRGVVTAIKGKTIAYKNAKGEEYTTLRRYAFVLGKGKSCITLP